MPADDPVSKRINDAVQRLVEEFRGTIPSETVVQSAEEAVGAYRNARVTDFIPLLVYRSTREYLDTMARERPRQTSGTSTR
jgi:hypothetical protein